MRAGPLPDAFIAVLAEYGHTTAQEIHEMFASCILCQRDAEFMVVGLDRHSWFGKSKTGKLKFLLYGLCDLCAALPDIIARAEAVAFSGAIAFDYC